LYGFIPRTYCGDRVGALAKGARQGDSDPLDICVLSERPITRAEVILRARVVGGLKMIDRGEVDDKIVAILENDNIWASVEDLNGLPPVLVERLRHYFSTYKLVPGREAETSIECLYGRDQAYEVIRASMADYEEAYGGDH
jgi:inorganic pyrophosphatase